MNQQRKPITPEMIHKYFGQNARITQSFAGGWRVTTPNGGEIKISQSNIDPIYGGSDVYRAVVLLSKEAWGGGKVHGPAAFKLAALAHGEAEGVNLRVAERGRWTRTIVSCLIAWIGMSFSGPGLGPFMWLFVGGLVWLLMKWVAKRRAQRESDQLAFPFPRVGSPPRAASHDDAKRERWL